MHIAQFVHRYPPALGGAEAYTARLSDYLASCGDEVRVWTSTALQLEEMWRHSDSTNSLSPLARRASEGLGDTSLARRANGESELGGEDERIKRYRPLHFPGRRYILKALSLVPFRRWQCLTTPCNPVCLNMWKEAGNFSGPLDAVHALAFPYSFPIACGLRLARRRGVPFFVTPFLHLGDPTDPHDRTRQQYTRPHLRWLLRQADGVFVQTRLERDCALDLGVQESRIFLQGLGVESEECTGGNRHSLRAVHGISPDEVVVGHLANNSLEKGTCDLLLAAERLWRDGQRFRVMLAGPEMPNFRSFWSQFRAKEHVARLGVLSDEAKRDFFATIDLFALPSRTDSFGLVLLEAWANGRPNLVYRAGGPAELVRDGIDGLQSRCSDIEQLSIQLRRLIADEGLRHRLGNKGYSRIDREFRWEEKLAFARTTLAVAGETDRCGIARQHSILSLKSRFSKKS